MSGTTRALVLCGCACALLVVPAPARAFELSGGVSVGGLQIGTGPRLALSPFGGLLWRWERDFLLEVHNMSSVVPGARAGVYDRTAASLVYAWKTGKVSLGPSFSIYAMPVCGIKSCNRVVGVAPGGHAQTDWYFSEPLGVSVSANLDWAGGNSRVLHGDLVAMITAGPVWRFGEDLKLTESLLSCFSVLWVATTMSANAGSPARRRAVPAVASSTRQGPGASGVCR
ncbi:uncharacterized protein SOCEGT47_013910 [Sorangium cellulosum]|uniref:Secreted protein n=1 Tax=Sorangium cellulosum TaxID=56 RepID=A0A4P2PVT0_SORCE|nr:uncharacterized protein SOCEGT47_013910 [Sorangium cellulosum]